jgi:hypothetical protein
MSVEGKLMSVESYLTSVSSQLMSVETYLDSDCSQLTSVSSDFIVVDGKGGCAASRFQTDYLEWLSIEGEARASL